MSGRPEDDGVGGDKNSGHCQASFQSIKIRCSYISPPRRAYQKDSWARVSAPTYELQPCMMTYFHLQYIIIAGKKRALY